MAELKPEAVPSSLVCSVCGLAWSKHGKRPTAATCIRLLKAELSRPRYFGQTSVASGALPFYSTVQQ